MIKQLKAALSRATTYNDLMGKKLVILPKEKQLLTFTTKDFREVRLSNKIELPRF